MGGALAIIGVTLAVPLACTDDAKSPSGEIVLAIQTDVALPGSVDTLRIVLLTDNVVRFDQSYQVGPSALLEIPATLGIVPGTDANKPVLIRVIASKNGTLKMLREVTTTVPPIVATIRIPIRWMCDDSATETSPGVIGNAKCASGQTCIGGDCHDNLAPTSPDGNVFSGGTGTHDGTCFDVVACMAPGAPVPAADIDMASCTFAKPAVADPSKLNVALKIDNDGICDPSNTLCFVILDRAPVDGWHDLGNRIEISHAVCERITSGRVKAIVTSDGCPTKTETDNVCGPWSSVGTGAGPYDAGGPDAKPPGDDTTTDVPGSDLVGDRIGSNGTVLPDGRVVVVGGYSNGAVDKGVVIFDPAAGTFHASKATSAAGHLWAFWGSPLPILPDGRILIAGGINTDKQFTSVSELYDPVSDSFATTSPLSTTRLCELPLQLADKSFLLVGGWDSTLGNSLPSWNYVGDGTGLVERFDLATLAWTHAPPAPLAQHRLFGPTVLLSNGHAQSVGGFLASGTETNIEEYDPATGAWTIVGVADAICGRGFALPNGKHLLTGCDVGFSRLYDSAAHVSIATLDNPGGPSFQPTSPNFAQLANGDVIVVGGDTSPGDTNPTRQISRYHVAINTWAPAGQTRYPRHSHATVFALPSGDVMISGGTDGTKPAEIYHPKP